MSVPTARQAYAFLTPLRSKLTVFLVESRAVNLMMGRFLLACFDVTKAKPLILDTDALYSSQVLPLAGDRSSDFLRRGAISVPEPTSRVDIWAARSAIQAEGSDVILIDDLNEVYHTMGSGDRKTAMRRLAFISALCSMLSKTRGQCVFSTLYGRDAPVGGHWHKRDISTLGDVAVKVKGSHSHLSFERSKGSAWDGGTFSVSLSP
jgi:hypothetical protein